MTPRHPRMTDWRRTPRAVALASLRSARGRDERGSMSAIELMALTPMCALLVLTILWAGRSAQAELATSLAAQEAAVAAAVCCNRPVDSASNRETADDRLEPIDDEGMDGSNAIDATAARELVAETVVTGRPSLERLCAGGPQPGYPDGSWTAHTAADIGIIGGDSSRPVAIVHVVTAQVACDADGAAAPVRGLFPARTVYGYGTHIATTRSGDLLPPGQQAEAPPESAQ